MKPWQRFFWQWRGALVVTPTVAGLIILLRFVGLFQSWEWAAFDQYLRIRPPEATDSRVVIVGLDENDIKQLGQAVVTDAVYAELLEKVRSQSPRAIGLDVYRDLPVEPGYDQLTKVFETTPYLVGIQKVVGEAGIGVVAPPPALAAKGQVGANDLVVDADNTVRRGLLSVQDDAGNTVYSLSLYLALLYLDAEGIGPETVEEGTWRLGKTTFTPFSSSDGGYVRADDAGYQQLINYRGPQETFERVSFTDVLQDRLPENWASDKVVLIGAVGESFKDTLYTPYSSSLLSLPQQMGGVEIHANLTSQTISAAMEGRSLIRSWSEPVEWAWILLWSGTGASLIWVWGSAGLKVKRIWQQGGLVLGAIALLFGSTYIAFCYSWWLPIVPALLAATGSATGVTAYLAYTAGDIRRTFGRYLSDEIVTTLLENPEGQKLGGERRNITLLTSDLRGFTATSERLPPETVIKVLNFYLGCMADVITCYGGTIDEFMGDGILILFGAPIQRADDAERAVACSVAMQLAMSKVNQQMKEWELAPLEMGIGIHTGEVVVGNIGSEKRTKYGVVGSPVNLTYRIESFTTGGQILISSQTHEIVSDLIQTQGQRDVKPKGVAQPITIYDVASVGAPYNLALIKEEEQFLALDHTIPVLFSRLAGKHTDGSLFSGQLIQLSDKGALLQIGHTTQIDLEITNNIKLNLLVSDSIETAAASEDIYAKVLEKSADLLSAPTIENSKIFRLRFTAKSPAITAYFTELYQRMEATQQSLVSEGDEG